MKLDLEEIRKSAESLKKFNEISRVKLKCDLQPEVLIELLRRYDLMEKALEIIRYQSNDQKFIRIAEKALKEVEGES